MVPASLHLSSHPQRCRSRRHCQGPTDASKVSQIGIWCLRRIFGSYECWLGEMDVLLKIDLGSTARPLQMAIKNLRIRMRRKCSMSHHQLLLISLSGMFIPCTLHMELCISAMITNSFISALSRLQLTSSRSSDPFCFGRGNNIK